MAAFAVYAERECNIYTSLLLYADYLGCHRPPYTSYNQFYLDLAASASKRRLASAFSDDTTRNAAMSSGSVVLSADATSRQTSKEIDVFVETITDLMDDLKEQCASRLGLQYTPSGQ